MPSQIEVANASKVLAMLEQIEGITYEQVREDIFIVMETETGNNLTATVDVEESVVSILMDVVDVPEDSRKKALLFEKILQFNAGSVHGFYAVTGSKVILKDNLEYQNMDQNELEAALLHVFMNAASKIEDILDVLESDKTLDFS